MKGGDKTHAGEANGHVAVGVDDGFFTEKLRDLADNCDSAVNVVVERGRRDAWCEELVRHFVIF